VPSNIEFIQRMNGLDSVEEVRRIVFDASYLVMGLGDVYLGAPVATPLDPRHRLVTTKYNPARTWTPENAWASEAPICVSTAWRGLAGYQFVGRTVQMWNRYRRTEDFRDGKQWLLRFFDQIRFYPVSAAELMQMRADFPYGRFRLDVQETTLRLRDYRKFLADNAHVDCTVQGTTAGGLRSGARAVGMTPRRRHLRARPASQQGPVNPAAKRTLRTFLRAASQ